MPRRLWIALAIACSRSSNDCAALKIHALESPFRLLKDCRRYPPLMRPALAARHSGQASLGDDLVETTHTRKDAQFRRGTAAKTSLVVPDDLAERAQTSRPPVAPATGVFLTGGPISIDRFTHRQPMRLTLTLTGRGERRRASGPLKRAVGAPLAPQHPT